MPSARSEISLLVIASGLCPYENDWSNTTTKANWSHLLAMEVKVVCSGPGAGRMPVFGSTSKAAGDLGMDLPSGRVPRKRKNAARSWDVQSPVNIGSMYTVYPTERAMSQKKRFTMS